MSETKFGACSSTPASIPDPSKISEAEGSMGRHNFSLSHPKNYLGVPIAVDASGATGALVMQHLVNMAGEARRGATALGLLTEDGELTGRGGAVVAAAESIANDSDAALRHLQDLKGSQGRFITSEPAWGSVAQTVFASHPVTKAVVDVLETTDEPLPLPKLSGHLATSHPDIAADYFLDTESIPADEPVAQLASVAGDEPIIAACNWLGETSAYQTQTTYQLKSLLCHVGILSQPGVDSSQLVPREDRWSLSPLFEPCVRDAAFGGEDR